MSNVLMDRTADTKCTSRTLFYFFFYNENTPMQYTEIFWVQCYKSNILLIRMYLIYFLSAQNIDCGYTLEPPVNRLSILTSTHNLCFRAKLRNLGIPLHIPVLLYKSGVQGGYTLHGHYFVMLF